MALTEATGDTEEFFLRVPCGLCERFLLPEAAATPAPGGAEERAHQSARDLRRHGARHPRLQHLLEHPRLLLRPPGAARRRRGRLALVLVLRRRGGFLL